VTLTEPAIAAILAVVIVEERLAAAGWTGLGIIGGALLILAVAPANAVARQADQQREDDRQASLGAST
jgi:DME family drug/metabolite transporter